MGVNNVDFESFIDCFISKRTPNKQAKEILIYFFGDDLNQIADAYISKRAQRVFLKDMPQDDARIEIAKVTEILNYDTK